PVRLGVGRPVNRSEVRVEGSAPVGESPGAGAGIELDVESARCCGEVVYRRGAEFHTARRVGMLLRLPGYANVDTPNPARLLDRRQGVRRPGSAEDGGGLARLR